MVLLLAIAFTGLGYRLVDLQILRRARMLPGAEERTQRILLKAPRRGSIYDSHQILLAGSETVKTVCADPSLVGTNLPVSSIIARALAPILDMPEEALMERFQMTTLVNSRGETVARKNVPLKRKVSLEDCERIRAAMSALDFGAGRAPLSRSEKNSQALIRRFGIFPDSADDQKRVYPNGSLAAHIIGLVESETKTVHELSYGDNVGVDGVEYLLNQALTGTPGWRKTEVARSRELTPYREQDVEARNGNDAFLTIDAGVQHILETELVEAMELYKPAGISAVVVRPRTGEIVALANLPTFDPNNPGRSAREVWRNRAITDMYEPGSTFKIVTVAGALNDGLVTLQSQIDCEHGYYIYAKRRLKDDHPLGVATVEDIVARSSNIGTAKLGIALGKDRVHEYVRSFGFGEVTGLGLRGEVKGLVQAPKKWSQLQLSRVPIGQGVAVTPLQMVMAMSAVANGGRLMQPYLVDRVVDSEGRTVFRSQPRMIRQVVQEGVARSMVAALKRVVSTNGTAPKASLTHYTVAGKTGTAERPEDGGYAPDRYVGSFIGFFPADNPELCIGIVMDDLRPPFYYGSLTAVPTFKKVAERTARYLALKPDVVSAETQLVSSTTNRGRASSTNN